MKKNIYKQGVATSALVGIIIALLMLVVWYLVFQNPQEAIARLDNCENLLGTCKPSCSEGEIKKELGDCGKGFVCCVGEQALV